MTTALDGHIVVDDQGIARIAGSRMKVIHLVMDKIAHNSIVKKKGTADRRR